MYYLHVSYYSIFFLFFFNDTATTEIYTLSLHDALPICAELARQALARDRRSLGGVVAALPVRIMGDRLALDGAQRDRSEEHTSELQSQSNLVCRLLLEKKKYKVHRR